MVFSSLIFLYAFLPLNLIFYFMFKHQGYRNGVLIVFSLFFYAWGEPIWVTILIFSACIDFVHGLIAEKYRGQWQGKVALISSITVNLSLLVFFKYSGFLVDNINTLWGTNLVIRQFGLPIGISFYSFQTISYVIDVYRGEVAAQRSVLKLLLFVSLFHQLVAGPIVRYKEIAAEIENRSISWASFGAGVQRFAVGLGKKVILANTAGARAAIFLDGSVSELSVLGAWFGISLFALQIYFDFSGYSDMAIGLGKMFGFTYLENFNYPYISQSIGEFWRRWHMSLGRFFRDYVYIPLGGSRRMGLRNLFLVWFLTGLWHGASWNFVLWGLYYGAFIALERLFLGKVLNQLHKAFSHIYVIGISLAGWVLFYFVDLSQGLAFFRVMLGLTAAPLTDVLLQIHFANNLLFLAVAVIACTPLPSRLYRRHILTARWSGLRSLNEAVFGPVYASVMYAVSTALLVGGTYNPFLYFRF